MLELVPLAFSCLLDHGAEMPDELGYIPPSFHYGVSLLPKPHDVVLAINVDVAQIKTLQLTAGLDQGCSELGKLTGLYFAEGKVEVDCALVQCQELEKFSLDQLVV